MGDTCYNERASWLQQGTPVSYARVPKLYASSFCMHSQGPYPAFSMFLQCIVKGTNEQGPLPLRRWLIHLGWPNLALGLLGGPQFNKQALQGLQGH